MKQFFSIFFLVLFVFGTLSSQTSRFILMAPGIIPGIVVDTAEDEIIHITASLLADDMERLTGIRPPVFNSIENEYAPLIIVGTINSRLIQYLRGNQRIQTEQIQNQWEVFSRQFVHLSVTGKEAMVICGSDNRGTAYGVFHLSEQLGVSPWYWWGDVTVHRRDSLIVPMINYNSNEPSVKYRGVFLNDEDWGLKPWAAKTFEPETGDIGPKTYARIFELLLRLKANTIWPAMHNCTRAFFHYPGNIEMARKYNIVIGSSHAEPMLRNNVDEWKTDSMGEFSYKTNRENVYRYWEQRVIQSKNTEAIYTMGMRGLHDNSIIGYNDIKSKSAALEQIINDQRKILGQNINNNIKNIPQAFIPYKEVLEIYDYGFNLPEDITIVWTDDNYGYIRRLNTEKESKRSGGSGIYYHISYWGQPLDYLWLSTTHPMLIWEELSKAWQTRARNIWIVNAGDIKPGEYNTQLFLDMAYDMEAFRTSDSVRLHFKNWNRKVFGKWGDQITAVLWNYYNLAFERKPEFMGWSRTEPSTPTYRTGYNHFFYGDEAQKRIDSYSRLEDNVKEILKGISDTMSDAFFQQVYYPVVCASLMNKKFLYADKAVYYSHLQNRISANDYKQMAQLAFNGIVENTLRYNQNISKGKWSNMMDYAPRSLSAFKMPEINVVIKKAEEIWDIIPEGYLTRDSCLFAVRNNQLELPVFSPFDCQSRFIDIFLTSENTLHWKAKTSENWISLSESEGELNTGFGKKEKRIWVSIDRKKIPDNHEYSGYITFRAGGVKKLIEVRAHKKNPVKEYSHVESNGVVSIFAGNFSGIKNTDSLSWIKIEGLGHTGSSLLSMPLRRYPSVYPKSLNGLFPSVEYDFCTFSDTISSVIISCIPSHPLNLDSKLRLAVAFDDLPYTVIDFTTLGRSEEWKQNVLSNSANRTIDFQMSAPGCHTLKLFALDPGVILDNIVINLGGLVKHYGIIEESIRK
jgi:hypothetical protein